jgi:uncharacterized spore protein YtfJ
MTGDDETDTASEGGTVSDQSGVGQGVISAITRTMESSTSRQVFSDPITSGDITVIPAAKVRGGGGGGGGGSHLGKDKGSGGDGSGAGVSLSARPVGAFVVRGSNVAWRPAVDVNRIVLGGQIVAIVGLLVARAISKQWRRRR